MHDENTPHIPGNNPGVQLQTGPTYDPDDHRREAIAESHWDDEPDCPKCGVTISELHEVVGDSSSSDWECDNCGALLEVEVEYSASYKLTHYKPSKRDRRLKRQAESRRREHEEYLRRTAVERRAAKELREARRKSAPGSWDLFPWGEWVPEELASEIRKCWRTPFEYLESLRDRGSPENGTPLVIARDTCGEYSGRYIYAWGNIGRVVEEDGTIRYVSFSPRGKVRPICSRGDQDVPLSANSTPSSLSGRNP